LYQACEPSASRRQKRVIGGFYMSSRGRDASIYRPGSQHCAPDCGLRTVIAAM